MSAPTGRVVRVHAWRRLWLKLALFGALGVVITHAVHLVVANTISARALEDQVSQHGRTMVDLVARRSADDVLTRHVMELQDLVDAIAADPAVAYCFILDREQVVASSFHDGTPAALVRLRRGRGSVPLVVQVRDHRTLDLVRAIASTSAEVRLGMKLDALPPVRRRLSLSLGSIAIVVIAGGVLAAFAVGRRISRPVGDMVHALQTTDPTRAPTPIAIRGTDEIALLAQEVNTTRERLHDAHLEHEQARRSQLQTEKLASLGQLVAGVAHEINNPLAGLKNCQRRLLREDLPPEKRREYLALMSEGLDRVEAVVGGLLDFARVRAPRRTKVALAELARVAASLVRPGLTRGQELVVRDDPAGRIEVEVDAAQVSQALVNLILNAVYATPDGGIVEIGLRERNGMVGVVVRDQGPGIPEEIRSQIEDPFFTTKPEGEGTGLGLSVTRGIAVAHGGDLTYEFPERGTVVTLWLLPAAVSP